MSASIAFANAHAPDRIVAVGLLALRPLRYAAEGRAPETPPIEGLAVEAVGHREKPGWHQATGLYGFLALPPGPMRLLVTDPQRRWLPAAFSATVPDRGAVKRSLERGVAEPNMAPRPLIRDIALHPAPGRPLMPGVTAVHGVVRAAGRPVPLARLALTTLLAGALRTHITWSADDGSFLLSLPGERPDAIGGAPPFQAQRLLVVHAPRPPLAAALAADPLAGLPAERDAIAPDAPGSPFLRRGFALRAADGTLRSPVGGVDPTLEILGGQQRRWDIELV
jgi:hypothetical protein